MLPFPLALSPNHSLRPSAIASLLSFRDRLRHQIFAELVVVFVGIPAFYAPLGGGDLVGYVVPRWTFESACQDCSTLSSPQPLHHDVEFFGRPMTCNLALSTL